MANPAMNEGCMASWLAAANGLFPVAVAAGVGAIIANGAAAVGMPLVCCKGAVTVTGEGIVKSGAGDGDGINAAATGFFR